METGGDPMSEKKWFRRSLRRIGVELEKVGQKISPPTVGRILKKLDYSPKANLKEKEGGQDHPETEAQFQYIGDQYQKFQAEQWPIISVDTKKKELIGDFKNQGRNWCQTPEVVNTHDFPSDAQGRAVPYGIYDVTRNCGSVYVGLSADTPEFAVEAISRWWLAEGKAAYPTADQLLILADSGGSNGCCPRCWKHQVQHQLSDRLGLSVTVCHFPTGCSKYNPIEHRLFSQISVTWAGTPLRTLDTILEFIRATTTTTGLTVTAFLLDTLYPTGKTVSDAEMKTLALEPHQFCPQWNYTIYPRLQTVPA